MERSNVKIKLWILWVLLIIFPPLGIVFLWYEKKYSKPMKLIVTIVIGLYFIGVLTLLGLPAK